MNDKELFRYRIDHGPLCYTTLGVVEATDEKEAEELLRYFYDDITVIHIRRVASNDIGICEILEIS